MFLITDITALPAFLSSKAFLLCHHRHQEKSSVANERRRRKGGNTHHHTAHDKAKTCRQVLVLQGDRTLRLYELSSRVAPALAEAHSHSQARAQSGKLEEERNEEATKVNDNSRKARCSGGKSIIFIIYTTIMI